MPDKRTMKRLMEDATGWCENYRSTSIDPAHRRADRAYHGILENEADYIARGRSMLYIPKTRDHVRRWVTTITSAFFGSDDVVTLSNPVNEESQRFTNEVFNIRLEKYMNFFTFLAHAAHAHVKYGNAVGKTGWDYEEKVSLESGVDPETGEEVQYEVAAPVKDAPFFDLVPFENVQIDYRCQGPDPVQESPFFREWIPMYISEVSEKFKSGEWKRPRKIDWKTVSVPANIETVRKERHGKMKDPAQDEIDSGSGAEESSSYNQVWVVYNFFRIGGTDWCWISIGDEAPVTEAQPVSDKFVHGRRPYALSRFDPEAFRVYSDGLPEMMRHLQSEVNAIRNQRRDNVSLVLASGTLVSRSANANMESLTNRRPGWIGVADRIDEDNIKFITPPDVTASSYREEEIANRDVEEISAQSQNRLGVMASDRQTATEAAITASAAGEQEAFVIKSFVDSFVKPLFEMFLMNLVEFEEDELVLLDAANATGLPPDPSLLSICEIVINAGMGSTNKELRAARIREVLSLMIQAKFPLETISEVLKELFPLLGFKNVNRFLKGIVAPTGQQVGAGGAPPPQGNPPSPSPQSPPGIAPDLRNSAENVPALGGYARGLLQ